jgi:double zinc ribbon protein
LIYLRWCPACGEEYQPHMTRCLDCAVALEDKLEGASLSDEPPPVVESSLPPGDYRVIAAGLSAPRVETLVQSFISAGIPVKVESAGYALRLSARNEERSAALAILEGEGVIPRQPDPSEPAVAAAGGPCPACGKEIGPGTLECAECGLRLGGGVDCESCGVELSPDDAACPACGHPQG